MKVRPSWLVKDNWCLLEATLQPSVDVLATGGAAGKKKKAWSGLPSLFTLMQQNKDFVAWFETLPKTCGPPPIVDETSSSSSIAGSPVAPRAGPGSAVASLAASAAGARGPTTPTKKRNAVSMAAVAKQLKKM